MTTGQSTQGTERDIEFAYVGQDNAEVAGNNSGPVAREMDSASQLIHQVTRSTQVRTPQTRLQKVNYLMRTKQHTLLVATRHCL